MFGLHVTMKGKHNVEFAARPAIDIYIIIFVRKMSI